MGTVCEVPPHRDSRCEYEGCVSLSVIGATDVQPGDQKVQHTASRPSSALTDGVLSNIAVPSSIVLWFGCLFWNPTDCHRWNVVGCAHVHAWTRIAVAVVCVLRVGCMTHAVRSL